MADVRSKNLYELLGNDPEQDSDREPEPPTKAIDKTAPRHGKRDAPKESLAAPIAPRGGGVRGDRRGGRVNAGNEEAFHDRNAGSYNNRNRPTDEQKEAGRRGIRARDDRGARTRQDRHPVRTGHTDTEKQVGQGWGANKGDAEWNDEKAGEAIARTEENAPQTPLEGGELAAAEEEADKSKSYAEYLAEQAAGKREELGVKAARAPNEGVKDKKWEAAKEIKRDDEEEAYIKGKEEKARRERQRKEKNLVDVDMRFVEPTRGRGGTGPREGGRGGRGARGGRGGRGSFEGGSRGGARGGSEGGRGGPRGGFEGGRGAPRGGYEGSSRGGGRGGPTGPTVDEKNFPSLGGK